MGQRCTEQTGILQVPQASSSTLQQYVSETEQTARNHPDTPMAHLLGDPQKIVKVANGQHFKNMENCEDSSEERQKTTHIHPCF